MTAKTATTAVGTATVERGDEAATAPARPMRADAKRNYELLVTAARKVFDQEGGGASMEAIAKEAGVGIGTLYRHFPKRIDVVEAVYVDDVDELEAVAHTVSADLEPWPAFVAWLEAFVRYASGKKRFMNELHEAFEKDPALRSASRERIEGALEHCADACPGRGRGAHRRRRAGPHATARIDVHERHPHARSGRAVARHDRRRPAPAGLTPLRAQMPDRSVRTGAGSGTWGISALGGMVPSRPASKSSRACPISAFVFMTKGP